MIDDERLNRITDGDEELMVTFLQIFFEDTFPRVGRLIDAEQSSDSEFHRIEGHTIRGAALNLGLPIVSELARSLEEAGKKRDAISGAKFARALRDEVVALRQYCAQRFGAEHFPQ